MKRRRYLTSAEMTRIGLSYDEQRLIGGFRGLTPEQQQSFLGLQASFVIANARYRSDLREARRAKGKR
jgi:hypothetical protein